MVRGLNWYQRCVPGQINQHNPLRGGLNDSKSLQIIDFGSGTGRPWQIASLFIRPEIKFDLTLVDTVTSDTHGSDFCDGRTNLKIIRGDVLQEVKKLDSKSYDLAFCMDVLEHLPQHDAFLLIYELNRISKQGVGVSVPAGFAYQPPQPDNPFQAHISAWSYKLLKKCGFSKIRTYNGLSATTPLNKKIYRPSALTAPLLLLETVICWVIPHAGANFWAENRSDPSEKIAISETAASDILFDQMRCQRSPIIHDSATSENSVRARYFCACFSNLGLSSANFYGERPCTPVWSRTRYLRVSPIGNQNPSPS